MNSPRKPPTPPASALAARTIQPKAAPARPSHQAKQPTAPPVYRPQPAPKVLQGRMTNATPKPNQTSAGPVAPPAYRPQPLPKVLQTKQRGDASPPALKARTQAPSPRPASTPPVLQRKPNAPQRPSPPSPLAPHARPTPPRLPTQAGGTIQRTILNANAYGVAVEGTDDLSLIHRVEPDIHPTRGTVRVYLTVFAYSDKKYKDIHAEGTGIKLIAKTHDTMMNLGDPRRAFHYVNTYTSQKNPAKCPIIRCFEIPRALYDEITGNAISESQRAKLGRNKPYNVDKERGQNQFGVPPKARDDIERLGTNLISYVPAEYVEEMSKNPKNGTVLDMDVLRKQLGMPTEGRKFLAPMNEAHVPSPLKEAEHGAILTRLYDDLDVLVSLKSQRMPALNQEMKIHRNCFKSGGGGYYGDHVAPLVRVEQVAKKSIPQLIAFRDEIGRAATFSVIPQMVTEEYHQANAQLHGQDKDKRGNPLSSWARKQDFQVVKPKKVEPKAKVKKQYVPPVVNTPPVTPPTVVNNSSNDEGLGGSFMDLF